MVTVLGVCTTEEHNSVVHFLWAKELNAKDIHKETFPVYGGKCLSRTAVHIWVKKRGKHFADNKEVATEVWKWLRQQSKDFYAMGLNCHGSQRSGKAMGHVYPMSVEDMLRNKCFSQVRISYVLHFISICELFIDSPS
jgi:hypothetical protein